MAKFNGTPGSWTKFNDHVVISDVKPERKGYLECDYEYEKKELGGYLVCESIPLKEDAQLIASAPDLLEALQSIVDYWNTPQKGSLNDHVNHSLSIAEKAIKKALGS